MAKNMALIKLLFFIVSFFYISSCSSSMDNSNVEKVFDLYKNRNKEIKIVDIPKEKINGLPFDVLELRTTGILKQGVFLSMTSRDNFKNFTSGMGQIITMDGALISKTYGMNVFLNSLEIIDKNPFDNFTKITNIPDNIEKKYKFLLPTNTEKEILFKCEIKIHNEETITLLGKKFTLKKVIEDCFSKNQSHKNTYWMGDDGYVWKSRQWLSGDNIYADINVLKKL